MVITIPGKAQNPWKLRQFERIVGEKTMSNSNSNVERGGCRFGVKETGDGKPSIVMELYHQVPRLSGITLAFVLLSGINLDHARDLVDKMNEHIIGVTVTAK